MSRTRPSTPMTPDSTTSPSSSNAVAAGGYTRSALRMSSAGVNTSAAGAGGSGIWGIPLTGSSDGTPSAMGAADGGAGAWDDPATADSLGGSDGGGGTAVLPDAEE